ncbi:hypothetical protein [Paenibacillus sp. TC-CSREp1]
MEAITLMQRDAGRSPLLQFDTSMTSMQSITTIRCKHDFDEAYYSYATQ